MSFFYNLNKTLASIAGKDSEAKTQATESVQQSELKTILESSYSAKAAAAGKDIGKPGKQFSKIAKSAGERYGSKAAGERVAGAVLNKLRNKTEEGNEFSGKLAQAKAQHKDSFDVDGKTYPVKEEGMSAKEKSFAALADPKDKITFADKIAGAKKEVDEMLGDVAADAMKNAIGKIREIEHDDVEEGKQDRIQQAHKLIDRACGLDACSPEELGDHRIDMIAQETGLKRGHVKSIANHMDDEDVDEGWDDMKQDVKQRMGDMSKMKPGDKMAGRKHDIEKTTTGIKATRRTDPDGISTSVDNKDADGEKRGRGRPKGTGVKMGAKGPSGKSKLMTRENDEYDDEAGMAKQDLAQAKDAAEELRSILASDENLPEWVQAKITKAVDYLDTARDYIKSEKHGEEELDEKKDVKRDNKAEKDGKKVTKDIEYDEKKKDGIHGKKRDAEDDKAEKAGKEVAKDVEYDQSNESEEKPKKAKGGIDFGGSVYENLDAQLEGLITEGMNVTINMTTDDNGQDRKTVTVTAEDDDAVSLVELLRNAGMGNSAPESCPTCSESTCECEMVEENSPNWPTDQETSNDALQYAGGLNKPKSTGQTTTPVIASQLRRQVSMEESVKLERSLFDLYKDFTK